MAEREGFEPSYGYPVHTISSRAPSTNSVILSVNLTLIDITLINSLVKVKLLVETGYINISKNKIHLNLITIYIGSMSNVGVAGK